MADSRSKNTQSAYKHRQLATDDRRNDDIPINNQPTQRPLSMSLAPTPTRDFESPVPTGRPTSSPVPTMPYVASSDSSGKWYNSDAFIITTTLVGVFLLVGALFNFWWFRSKQSRRDIEASPVTMKQRGGRNGIYGHPSDAEQGVYTFNPMDEPMNNENAALLPQNRGRGVEAGGGRGMAQAQASRSGAASNNKQGVPLAKAQSGSVPRFQVYDKEAGQDSEAALMRKFNMILGAGLVINLHTTKGPKPVLLSLHDDEVRWQAAKTPQKRYKLNLKQVTFVEEGKNTSNFVKMGRVAEVDHCFSLLTNNTTLDLEASSKLERDCLVRGFNIARNRVQGMSV